MPRRITQEELNTAQRFGDLCPVYKVDDSTIVKFGDCVRFAEAEAMRLVRQALPISPVPRGCLTHIEMNQRRLICHHMEFIEGDTLENVWDSFSPSQKGEIIEQLQGYFSHLRDIKGDFIGSVDRTACEDPLFDNELGAYGPFRDENEFNGGIVNALKRAESSSFVDMIGLMIHSVMKNHDIVLTHGDFAPRNILVRGTTVVAVLDWELSGFYPEYWEYFKALRTPSWQSQSDAEIQLWTIFRPLSTGSMSYVAYKGYCLVMCRQRQ